MTELACSRIKRRISRRRPPQQSVLSTSYGGKFTVSRPNAAVTDKIPNEVGSCGVHAPEGGALHQAYRTCKQGNKVNSYGVANSIGHGEVASSRFEPIRRQPPRSLRLIRYRGALSPDVHYSAFRDVPGRKAGFFCAITEIRFLEVQKIVFIHTSDRLEDAGANQHGGTANPVDGLGHLGHLLRDRPALE